MFEVPHFEHDDDALKTLVGPVWTVPARDVGVDADGDLLVRQLLEPVDFLSTGAVLRLTADQANSHIFAPNFWARSISPRDEVWIAQRPPHGVPLAQAQLGRLGWAEALELWTPLAEAVSRMHRNGAFAGAFTPWNVWFDARANKLAVADCGTWIGDAIPRNDSPDTPKNWWAPELRCDARLRQPSPAADVYGLAWLLLQLALPEQTQPAAIASAEGPNLGGLPPYAIVGVRRALAAAPQERPQRVSELIAATSPSPTRTAHVDAIDAGRDVLYGRAFNVEHVEHPQRGRGVKFTLTHPDYDPYGAPIGHTTTGTFFWERGTRDIYESVQHVWEGSEINLLDAREIEDSKGTNYFTAQPATLPVLEPHWPVTVTNTLKAEGCVSKYFVDLRDSGRKSRALVFGSLLHGMLDDIARAPGDLPTFEQCWDARIGAMRLGLIAAGLGDADLEQLEADARHHFNNISGFAHGRDAAARERIGWSGENVEVTRYSSIYGLEGRIDLVTEDARAGLHIVELKSGSERDEHASQVRCYKLLWDGVAQKQGMAIRGYLLYSKSGLMRSAPTEDPLRERRILRARNQLVAAQKAIAEGVDDFQLPYYLMIPSNCHAFCKFRKDRCREQSLLLGIAPQTDADEVVTSPKHPWQGHDPELVRRAWRYWRHFSRLLELENWDEGERIGRILQSGRLRERVAAHEAIANLKLTKVDVASGQLTFTGDVPRIFMPNDAVVAHRGDFHSEHILRGTVVELTADTLTLWTQGAPNAASLAADGWIVDSLPFRMGHRASTRALYGFLQRRDDRLLRIILHADGKEAMRDASLAAADIDVAEATRSALNDQQLEAVRWGLGTHGACLIQGPPGTGKTTVIAHLVRELVADGQRVLLAAQTNTAVDTMLQALLEVGVRDFLRVGHAARSDALVASLAARGEDPLQFFTSNVGESTASLDALARRIAYTQVIGCTTHRAVGDDVIDFLTQDVPVPFDVAIVDEATQISEPMTLAPIRLARRFVLVGDHRQLPPIVTNERATTAAVDGYAWFGLDDEEVATADAPQLGLFGGGSPAARAKVPMGLGGLDRSLFERLVQQGLPHVMLEQQYRMNREIQAYSSRAYYGERLVPHALVEGARLQLDAGAYGALAPPLRAVLDPAAPVVFCDVHGEAHGRVNLAEAEAVARTVEALVACGAVRDHRSVGVVTPFRAQGQAIRRLLAERLGEAAAHVAVDTVERYQGSERETIIVSLVKTEQAGEFLADDRRVNVTLTRARRKLVLFGHRECLLMSPLFRNILTQSETVSMTWPTEIDG